MLETKQHSFEEPGPLEAVNRLVLIADGNTGRGRRLAAACERAGVSCLTGAHGAAALEMALSERPGLVVAQVDLPLVDAPKLAEILRANPRTRRSRFLFLGDEAENASAAGPGDVQLPAGADTDSIVRAIEDLIGRQDRLDAVDRAAATGEPVSGDLELVGLADLLSLFQANRASGRLHLESEGEELDRVGHVLIRDGDVLQVECGTASNEKALFRLFGWRQGRFEFEPGSIDDPAFIATSTRLLIQEGMRQLGEWNRVSTKLPPLDATVKMHLRSGDLPNIVHPLTQEVLMLLELYATVREVVDHCSFPDYQVLRTLATLADREIVEVGRAPVPPSLPLEGEEPALFNEAQIRRLQEWVEVGSARGGDLAPAKLLIAGSDPAALPDFAFLLSGVPGVVLTPRMREGRLRPDDLETIGTLDLGDGLLLEFIHVPRSETYAPLWPLAGHRALGTLFLLNGGVAQAADRLGGLSETLAELPRARTFHVAMLRKGERISPDELRENLTLIDEASLFLLPVESTKPPAALLRGLFSRDRSVTPEDLKRFPLLAELSGEDRESLFDLLETEMVRKGRSVFRETSEADGLVLLVSGSVRLSRKDASDLGTLEEGAILGSASLLTMGRREATVKADSDCEVALLSRNAYRRLVEDHPRTACRLTEGIAQDLSALLREALDPLSAASPEVAVGRGDGPLG